MRRCKIPVFLNIYFNLKNNVAFEKNAFNLVFYSKN